MSSIPKVTIIICTRDRVASLARTLESIGELAVPTNLPAELLIVDNGSTDETLHLLAKYRLPNMSVRYTLEPRPGQSRARNRGLAEASGDIILFTDDDVHPPVDWIEGMCRPLADGEVDAVAGGVRLDPALIRPWMNVEHRRMLACSEEIDPQTPRSMIGANMAFTRRVLARLGGFDEELGPGAIGLGDDTYFARALLAAGYRIGAALGVAVEHRPGLSRISRSSYLQMTERAARTVGYIFHHCQHGTINFARLRILKNRVLLWCLRLWYRPSRQVEGIPDWESRVMQKLYTVSQFVRERRRPWRYTMGGLLVDAPTGTTSAGDVRRVQITH